MKNVFGPLLLSERGQCVAEIHAFETSEVLSANFSEFWL